LKEAEELQKELAPQFKEETSLLLQKNKKCMLNMNYSFNEGHTIFNPAFTVAENINSVVFPIIFGRFMQLVLQA